MNKAIKITFLIISTIAFSLNAQNDKLNRDWVDEDKLNFKNLVECLSQENLSLKEFKSQIKNLDIREEVQIWKSCKRIEAVQYGGYISNWINLATIDKKIFSLQITIGGKDAEVMRRIAENDDAIKFQLEKNWKYFKETISDNYVSESYQFKYIDVNLKKVFEAKVGNSLGAINEVKLNGELKEAYNTLMNPIAIYDYGDFCYFGGTKPSGRKAIERIVAEKRIDLIKNIIRGYNPEGRAYGIEALMIAYSDDKSILNKEDEETIRILKKSKTQLNTCSGCFVTSSNYKEIIKQLKKNKN